MVDPKALQHPVISFRPVLPSDRNVLEKIHSEVFPIMLVLNHVIMEMLQIEDLLRASRSDQALLYILTLGVVEECGNRGIAPSLIKEVIKYASNLQTCQAVYLHFISYNNHAILLYKKLAFKCVWKLYDFYFINGQHYDAYFFVYYVNGDRFPCSLLEFVTFMVTYIQSALKAILGKVSWLEERFSRWPKQGDSGRCLVPTSNNRRHNTSENADCEYV